MLGSPKPRRLDQPIAVSLEDLVPADNFYRHPEAKLDLSFVREWITEHYTERGQARSSLLDPTAAARPHHGTPCGGRSL